MFKKLINKNTIGICVVLVLMLIFVPFALADNVSNDVVSDPPSITLIAGDSTSYWDVNFYIQPTSNDGDPQCNFDSAAESLTFSIVTPSGVIANPSTLTFTKCKDGGNFNYQSVRFSASSSAVSGDISFTTVSNTSGGTFNYSNAVFYVNIETPPPSDNTPPNIKYEITGTSGSNGWYISDVDVIWVVTDDESSISYTSGCDPTSINYETTGITLTCSATSLGGTNSLSVTIKIDKTGPSAVLSVSAGTPGTNGWYTSNVTVSTNGSDTISEPVICTPDQYQATETTGTNFYGACTNDAGLTTNATPLIVKLDKTPPTSVILIPSGTLGNNGWYISDVKITTTGSEDISTPIKCTADQYQTTDTSETIFYGSCTNDAGLTANAEQLAIKRDATPPTLTWNNGPEDGGQYYFGFVPEAPTCKAFDVLSGPNGCIVTGYGTTVGVHTLTATAHDVAGNSKIETKTYEVLAWNLYGFYQPVDMNGVWNIVKGGSTVPLKFEVFADQELTDPAVVDTFKVYGVSCPTTGVITDDIELTTTGGTSLRYDPVAGQFIQNWQTPKKPGVCYKVVMTTDDGSSLTAFFKLK